MSKFVYFVHADKVYVVKHVLHRVPGTELKDAMGGISFEPIIGQLTTDREINEAFRAYLQKNPPQVLQEGNA